MESQLYDAQAELRSLLTKVADLGKSCNVALAQQEKVVSVKLVEKIREHEAVVASVRAEAKMAAGGLARGGDGALGRNHGVLRSIRKIVKAADESHAKHLNTLTKLRLLFEEGWKVAAPASQAGSADDHSRIAELESALEARELELQTLHGLAKKNATLRADVGRLKKSVSTLNRGNDLIYTLNDELRDLKTTAQQIRSAAEGVKERNTELEVEA